MKSISKNISCRLSKQGSTLKTLFEEGCDWLAERSRSTELSREGNGVGGGHGHAIKAGCHFQNQWCLTLEDKHPSHVLPLHQGLSSPMLRCPSQRLLDRIVRRYAEVPDAGSIYMDHLTDQDKLRLLYTLSVNSHPILLQVGTICPSWKHHPHSLLQAWDVPQSFAALCKLPKIHGACFFYGAGWLKPDSLLQAPCISLWSFWEIQMPNPWSKWEPDGLLQ